MNAIELLFAALPTLDPPELPEDGVCCVLGTVEQSIHRKHGIKPTFTNLDLLRAPGSDRISVRAWRVLTHSEPAKEGKKRDTFPLLQSSWVCDRDGLQLLGRIEVRDRVLGGVADCSDPWCGYVTTSYKKHGSLRAPVNTGGRRRWLFEQQVVDCTDRPDVAEHWSRLLTIRTAGVPRPVIESLDAGVPTMRKHGAAWQEFERWARPRYHSALYRFLTYLLPGTEELKGAGISPISD